jgi:glycosyltransferase involved in cell wall biosynthesis
LESIDCLAGLFLRRVGKVKKVVYYVLDFSPQRYSNPLVNKFYLYLDKICARSADYIWDVSKEFNKVRIGNGLSKNEIAPVIRVPIGLYDYQIIGDVKGKRLTYSLIFVGTLGEENGPDLAIKTLHKVLKKYPKTTLHIIGGGELNLQRLKQLAKKENLSDRVKFYGYIENIAEMVNIIKNFDIALAPYRKIPGSIRYYADSAKIRTYAGAGLPVITTEVPPLGRELAELGGAIIANDDENSFYGAIDKVFSDPKLYLKMKEKVIDFSKDNTWNNEFDKAFARMQ